MLPNSDLNFTTLPTYRMENIHPDEGIQIDPYEKQKQYRIKRENCPSEITNPAGKPCRLDRIQNIQYSAE
jgi:hypothetical protein